MRKEFLINPECRFNNAEVNYRGRSYRICMGGLNRLFTCFWSKGGSVERFLVLEDKPSEESYRVFLSISGSIRIETRDGSREHLSLYYEVRGIIAPLLRKHGTLYLSMEIEE